MSIGLLFWVLMILALIFGMWSSWPFTSFAPVGMNLLVFILLGLLGWKVFGPALKE